MQIVNQHLNYPKANLIEPNTKGYIHIGAEIDLSALPFYLSMSRKKKNIISRAGKILEEISGQSAVSQISLFRAAVLPPAKQEYLDSIKAGIHVARFDLAVLIETDNIETSRKLNEDESLNELIAFLKEQSKYVHRTVLQNAKRINEVDKSRKGIFLFNYFHAEDTSELLPVWEYTAGWFTSNTGLDNSTLLLPVAGVKSEYGVINHCRWDKLWHILPKLIFSRSLRLYVRDNFEANKIASMPILYRLVRNYNG